MDYGRLSQNAHINARIYELFTEIHSQDVLRFVRKFRNCSDMQCFHIYRELILGAHLRRSGWPVRYECKFADRTPDWVLHNSAGHVCEIIDVVTLHQRWATDREIERNAAAPGGWTGWLTTAPDRLAAKVAEKADAYAALSAHRRVPYVVALFAEFVAPIEPREMSNVLYDHYGGVFAERPNVAGVIFFRERSGCYEFHDFPNFNARLRSNIVVV